MTSRPVRALLALTATTATVLALGAGTASAHVTVSSTDASPGGFGELTFRVPTESATASTVSLRVQLPTDTPLAFVSVQPVPGWTAATTTTPLNPPIESHGNTITEAVSEVTWTADAGAGIAPGEYQSFSISAGPLPDVDSLSLPAIQSYDDGSEAAWIEPVVDGQAEPERPAPTLTLAAASDGAGGQAAETSSGTTGDTATDTPAAEATDDGPSGVAVAALVVGVLALLAALAGLAVALGSRRRTTG
jgi:uncharacterized protein YcnI